jgi:hypothetical protein
MRVQLVGPISGRPNFNDANFQRVQDMLEDSGHEVWSPHNRTPDQLAEAQELLDQIGGGEIDAKTIHHFWLRISMEKLCSGWPEAICVLNGWEESVGANLEILTALHLGIEVRSEQGVPLGDFHYSYVRADTVVA